MGSSSQLVAIEELALQNGTFVVNNTTEYTNSIDALYVAEDTEFNSIKVNGVDARSTYIASNGVVKAGVIIAPLRGQSFSGVTLASGSVVAILK